MILNTTSNTFIEEQCKRLKIQLNGIYSKDEFKNMKPKNGCYVINLQDRLAGNGTHWTCLFIKDRKSVYYDSFGGKILIDIIKFCKKKCKFIKYNIDAIQNLKSNACGYYALYFLYFITKYKKCNNYGFLINTFNNQFQKNDTQFNDYILENYMLQLKII